MQVFKHHLNSWYSFRRGRYKTGSETMADGSCFKGNLKCSACAFELLSYYVLFYMKGNVYNNKHWISDRVTGTYLNNTSLQR